MASFLSTSFLAALYCFYDTSFNQFTNDKRLEQFSRHIFRQTTLVQFQFRTYHDYRTTGIVNTFTQQVLTETSLLYLSVHRSMISMHVHLLLLQHLIYGCYQTSESIASCSIRFSLRRITSGALISSKLFKRLLRMITRR